MLECMCDEVTHSPQDQQLLLEEGQAAAAIPPGAPG